MRASRASVTAVAAVVGGVLLMTLLVTWAASIGPGEVLTGEGIDPVRVVITDTETPPDPLQSVQDRKNDRLAKNPSMPEAFRVIAIVLEVLAGIVVLYLLYRGALWAYQTWRARRRPDPKPVEVDFDLLGSAAAAVAEQLISDAVAQREVLLGGTPRNAVVEAWIRFETQAAEAGVRRQHWETSSEFTLRLLELVHADSTAVAGLAALYRRARFSVHEISEADRAEALAALDAIHASLRSSAGTVP